MSPSVHTEELRLRYRTTDALDGVSLSLDGPSIVGLVGRNGSGKTSLMSLLAGFRRATGGTARVNGQPVFENPRVTGDVCLIRGAGDTIDHNLRRRVRDALKLAATLRPNWDAAYADALLRNFEIDPSARVGELSTGKRSALGSILGLASRAPVTLLDETSLGMDAPTRYTFYDEVLRDFMEHPRLLVLSSHLVDELSRILEQVVVIDRGRVLLHEDVETLRERGAEVSGPSDAVADFVSGRTVLNERRLGRTASAVVYGDLPDAERARAREVGLDFDPVPLQDLFVHLTGGEE